MAMPTGNDYDKCRAGLVSPPHGCETRVALCGALAHESGHAVSLFPPLIQLFSGGPALGHVSRVTEAAYKGAG